MDVVGADLHVHHGRVVPELVLALVEREMRPVGGQVELVVGLRALGHVLAVECAGDEIVVNVFETAMKSEPGE